MSKFYITTAIDYVNGPPHIGHALEKIQADVFARYHRQKGDDVLYLTGTDEHGAKIVRAAEAAGAEPQSFVDKISGEFRSLKEALNLSWDDFIRTSDQKKHWPGVVLMWEKLTSSGDIYKKTYKGLYCVGHEAFVTRKDLVDGKCEDHGKEPEVIEEENYFFRLSKYSEEIGKRIKSGALKIVPEGRRNEILSLIDKEGLEDVSFSRPSKDLSWGIPVPGDDTQTIYVWCDALTNYLSAIGYGQKENSKFSFDPELGTEGQIPNSKFSYWWPADVHVIGKDILRFHAAIWPGMLLSAGLPLPKNIFAHGFISVDGRKMSKTIRNVVNPVELVKKYGTDAVRYYLLREIPSHEDGDFSETKFRERYNGDLANGIGNFAARVIALASRDAKLRMHANAANIDKEIAEFIAKTKTVTQAKIEEFRLHEALASIWELISFGDGYVNENKPWAKARTGADENNRGQTQTEETKEQVIYNLVVILDNVAAMLAPFLPETAEKITKSIIWEGDRLSVKKIKSLFPRLT